MKIDFRTRKNAYQIVFQAIEHSERRPQIAEWDSYIDLIRKLKSIGTQDKDKLWELKPDAEEIDLDREQVRIVLECIEKSAWIPVRLEEVQDARKWLMPLKEV